MANALRDSIGAEVTDERLDWWACDPAGPVALCLKQTLLPVEGEGGVIFPPTYADIGYNIDTLSDGTRVATIDSVGSQANRLEPVFKEPAPGHGENPLAGLVPQIDIVLHGGKKGETPHEEKRSLLDLAHRSADAVVQSSPTLAPVIGEAFEALRNTGNATPLATLAPTSLIFGVWDSRGGTGEKRPRLIRAIIRAWDVDTLHSAAQFNSVWKSLSEEQQEDLAKEAKKKKIELSVKGFKDAPATFRKVGASAAKYVPEFQDGSPNPERRVLGGVLARGPIERDVTVNLVALRGIRGANPDETRQLQRYLLGLALVAATADIDLFLREGCHLRYADEDAWNEVPRRGEPKPVALGTEEARELIREYTAKAVEPFQARWPEQREHRFDLKEAKKLLSKKGDDDESGGE